MWFWFLTKKVRCVSKGFKKGNFPKGMFPHCGLNLNFFYSECFGQDLIKIGSVHLGI